MAQKQVIKIELPELTRPADKYETSPRRCVLTLETDKAYRGGVDCTAQVGWADNRGFVQFALGLGGGGDFHKVYVVRPGIATQKRIDSLHAEVFTPERIEQIKDEVRAYYYGYKPEVIHAVTDGGAIVLIDNEAGTITQVGRTAAD